MGLEIERKFLVKGDSWKAGQSGKLYRQGYVPCEGKTTVRVRVVGQRGYLTLKGPAQDLIRPEFEYEVPLEDAQAMLEHFCRGPLVEKLRYRIPVAGQIWEVDEFIGLNLGLVVAEIELEHPQQVIELPPWVGVEVTDDPKYYNSSLANIPFSQWDPGES